MSSQGDPAQLNRSLAALARLVISEESLETTANRIVGFAVQLIDGVDLGGLSLVRDRQIQTLGVSDELVRTVDSLQYETGEGPSLSSIKEQATFEIPDMSADTRWPTFSALAAQKGIGGLLSFVLEVSDDSLGALNLYSRSRHAFTPRGRATGALFAVQAAVSVANALTHDHDLQRRQELETGLVTRDLIGKATGILMEREQCSAGEAMAMLMTASQHLNRKLREIAAGIVDGRDSREPGA